MSGYSDQSNCPNCGKLMNTFGDHKPFDHVLHECLHCGLLIYPKVEYLDLDEINLRREEWELDPLIKLPDQTFNW